MNRNLGDKYVDKVIESNGLIKQLIPGEDLNNDRILLKLLANKDYFNKNYFDIIVRHTRLYTNEIAPLLERIKKVKRHMEEKVKDTILLSDNPWIAIVNVLKTRNHALFERIARTNSDIATHYVRLLKDMDNRGIIDVSKKRVVAIAPNGEETLYDNPHKASVDLLIHSGSITKCCQGMDYRASATSKKDGTKYKFRYEGEPLKIKENPTRKTRRQYIGKLDKILSSYEQTEENALSENH